MSAKRILVIAGTDSSGGAGLTRDTTVAGELGCEVLPVVTAVTAQTHAGVMGICPMSAGFVRQQLDAAFTSGSFEAVKIGMLGAPEIADCVAEWLAQRRMPVVIDPVLRSSSGCDLAPAPLPRHLLARADLLTPNLPEAATLTGLPIAATDVQIAEQAQELLAMGAKAVLIKGGHGTGRRSVDHLFWASGHQTFSAARLRQGKRGTGCTLATAIACHLASGRDLVEACGSAKDFVQTWLGSASETDSDKAPITHAN